MEEFIIPKTSLDLFNKIIKAYYITYSDEGVKAIDVSKRTGYSAAQIWKSNNFIIKIGILSKDEGKFKLTEIGKTYAEHLVNSRDEEAYLILKELMLQYKPIDYIIDFMKLEGKVTLKKLQKRIIDLAQLNLNIADHKAGLIGITEILLASKILQYTNGENIILGEI